MRRSLIRYVDWLGELAQGDFGTSIELNVPVADVLWPRLGNTAILAAVVVCGYDTVVVDVRGAGGTSGGIHSGSHDLDYFGDYDIGAGIRFRRHY